MTEVATTLTAQAYAPARLDIQDMPRDTNRCLGNLRQALCTTFNYVRSYPEKLATFIEVLEYVLQRAKEYGTPEAEAAVKASNDAVRQGKLDAVVTERNAVSSAKTKGIKEVAQADIKYAQGLTVLEELSEYIITTGYTVVGDTLETALAAFIKARTEKYQADSKVAKEEVAALYAERIAALEVQAA